jgi:hypothetical protein
MSKSYPSSLHRNHELTWSMPFIKSATESKPSKMNLKKPKSVTRKLNFQVIRKLNFQVYSSRKVSPNDTNDHIVILKSKNDFQKDL